MFTKEDVARTVEAIGALKLEPAVEVAETHSFGLGLDVFDPISGEIITVARPSRTDIGQSEVLLTPEQVAHAILAARMNRLHNVRAAGFASIEEAQEAHVRQQTVRDLEAKQAAERAALANDQAEARAKAVAEAQPKAEAVEVVETDEQRFDREENERRAAFQAQHANPANAQKQSQPRPAD